MFLPGGYGITYQTQRQGRGRAEPLRRASSRTTRAYNFAATAVGLKAGSTVSLLVEQEEKVVILDSTGSEGVLGGKGMFILQLTKADAEGDDLPVAGRRASQLDGAAEQKAGFEYGESPTPGKPLPIALLDKNADVTGVIRAKPEP